MAWDQLCSFLKKYHIQILLSILFLFAYLHAQLFPLQTHVCDDVHVRDPHFAASADYRTEHFALPDTHSVPLGQGLRLTDVDALSFALIACPLKSSLLIDIVPVLPTLRTRITIPTIATILIIASKYKFAPFPSFAII